MLQPVRFDSEPISIVEMSDRTIPLKTSQMSQRNTEYRSERFFPIGGVRGTESSVAHATVASIGKELCPILVRRNRLHRIVRRKRLNL